jgi:hypothetical protein
MRRLHLAGLGLAAIVCMGGSAQAGDEFSARINGFQEIGSLTGPTGAIFTNGTGKLSLDTQKNAITYSLTYSDLGSGVTQAHIHFGKVHVAGGIIAFLCNNSGSGAPAGTPACPASGGTVTGTLTPASVIGPTGQGIAAGNFDALLAALDTNTAYVNIHTSGFPAGEIRGQIREGDHH